MRTLYAPLLLLALLWAVASCKVQVPQSSSQASQPDSTTVADSLARLDSLLRADSLLALLAADTIPDTVAIGIHRLLPDTFSIIGVGDIMMGTNYPNTGYLPPKSQENLFAPVAHILRDAHVTFGNLEGVILNEGGKPKYCSNPKVCYLFRSPERYMQYFKQAGFDVLSTANNHAGDFGNPGRQNTMRVLDSLGFQHAGLQARPYTIFKDSTYGLKIGFCAFSPNTGTVSINDLDNAKAIVTHLDSVADIVMVSFHGGAEGSKHEHVTRARETFYGENRGNVYEFAHALVDTGADVIFGHGPHVTRAIEVYNNRFIAYSLGNFCTYARFNLRGPNGIAPLVKVFTAPDGKFLSARIYSIEQLGEGGPTLDQEQAVLAKLRALMKTDFPEKKLTIDPSGMIYPETR